MLRPHASLSRPLALVVMAGLLCAQGACSLRSLDYLKNGSSHDGAVADTREADVESRSTADVAGFDAASMDTSAQDGAGEISETRGTDGKIGSDGKSADTREAGRPEVGTPSEVAMDSAADGTTPDVPGTGAADSEGKEGLDVGTSGRDGDPSASEGGAADTRIDSDTALSTGGVSGLGGNGGAGGSGGAGGIGDARVGTGGSSVGDGAVSDTNNACEGLSIGGICWYLGPANLSCQQVCTSHGQTAPAAATYVGTARQGGGLLKCTILLGLLGVSGTPQTGTRTDGLGFGCHLFIQDGSTYWLSSPDFSVTASGATARLVCGCTQ